METKDTFTNSLAQGTVLHGSQYKYRIVRVLGQGTFGITYLAQIDIAGPLGNITMQVAVKEFFMKTENGRNGSLVTSGNKNGSFAYYRKKFLHEARNLSRLHHPNIIKVIEAFEDNGTVYYSMEYIDGGSLDSLIMHKRRLSVADTLRYTRDIASALQCMHDNKMLHLDLKPSNVMIRDGHAVLIDFGLSKQYGSDNNPESSLYIGRGTHGYAPLEQDDDIRDSSGFPVTMDVYALGATMLKMLTGNTPPPASYILNSGFPYNEFDAVGIDRRITDVVCRAMAPMKDKRTLTVEALLAQLQSATSIKQNVGNAIATVDSELTVVEATITPDGPHTTSYCEPLDDIYTEPAVPNAQAYKQQEQCLSTDNSSTDVVIAGPDVFQIEIVYKEFGTNYEEEEYTYTVTEEKVSMEKYVFDKKHNIHRFYEETELEIGNDEFEQFKQELQCLETCAKIGGDDKKTLNHTLIISLIGTHKKEYWVHYDGVRTFGNLCDQPEHVFSDILDILPKCQLLQNKFEEEVLIPQKYNFVCS